MADSPETPSDARAQLRALITHHQRIIDAAHTTLQALDDEAVRTTLQDFSAPPRPPRTQAARAATVERDEPVTRRATRTPRRTTRRATARAPQPAFTSALAQRRAKTQALLNTFDRTTARPGAGRGFGQLVRHGYLAKKGDGYVRTEKAFTV